MKHALWLLAISTFFGAAGLGNGAWAEDLNTFTVKTKVLNVVPGRRPSIATDNQGNLYVVFEANKKGGRNEHVFFVKSTDLGLTWTAPEDLANASDTCSHPRIAVEPGGAIDVVWSDSAPSERTPDIFFSHSIDGGKTWSLPTDISNTPGVSAEPALAIGPDNSIHVIWTDTSKGEKNKDIYYTSSSNGGKTWAKDPLLPAEDISNTLGSSTEPAVAVDENNIVHAVWLDGTPGETHPDIYYVYKEAGVWIKPVNVSHTPRLSDHPSLGLGPKGKVYITWQDYSQKPTAPDIWLAIGSRGGQFEKPVNISNTPGISHEPQLAADGKGRLAIVWTDTSKTLKQPNIFARISNDCANDFTKVMDVSNTDGFSKHPDVTITRDKMVAVWEETESNKSLLKLTSLALENLATGPATYVSPTIHGAESNAR